MTFAMTTVDGLASLAWTYEMCLDDGDWVITIAELPDFFAAGATPGEAAGNAQEALRSHLAGYLATGKHIPAPARHSSFPQAASETAFACV